ncbi:MAG TPA: hypothetical protein VE622_01760 [Nitrososphaeraceae archaeon]|nr:hypothetical protein [Nitrososphaeraceae archaeon]
MYKIPFTIKKYVDENISYPVGIIGCRATNPEMSFECCEYDLAIFSEQKYGNKILKLGNYKAELINLPLTYTQNNSLDLKGMIFLKGNDSFILSSIGKTLDPEHYLKVLKVSGKKRIINSLFYYEAIKKNIEKQSLMASMWLKICAYDFLGGILALSGSKPMPLHELNQIRHMNINRQDIADGVRIALECIGLERATKSIILRSLEAVSELISKEHDKELTLIKIKHLIDNDMFSDCYYYLGKIGQRILTSKPEHFCSDYIKLIQISLDLANDTPQTENLHSQLVKISKNILRQINSPF